ncbi:4-hydroxybenzoate polyprenyltransferase, mitochondrial [Toxocara canis]|uniref:4-hydroxybenzoate polyprenyltransferase, mitochondrial n=1 Tax=Toxocara canis TaxID=6265 RepID=A0A0B2VAQ3_TOXCA|nr:4-hydroxybenzoate polyprenyltransferase, mitochondrial [Toxocara canis]
MLTAGPSLCRFGVYRISSSIGDRRDASAILKHAPHKLSAAAIVELAPKRVQPYLKLMRVDKPAGTWLLYWPCTWSIALASPPGATLNWGVLIAWSHLAPNELNTVIPLFIANVLHTVIYDTIYSHQDKADDIVAGVKSTALLFGDSTKYWLTGFATLMVSGLTVTGALVGQTWPYYCMLGATAAQLSWQIGTLKIDEPDDCWTKFRSNQWLGAMLFVGIVAGNLLRKQEREEEEQEQHRHLSAQ